MFGDGELAIIELFMKYYLIENLFGFLIFGEEPVRLIKPKEGRVWVESEGRGKELPIKDIKNAQIIKQVSKRKRV